MIDSTGKPKITYTWVLIGPKPGAVTFDVYCFDLLYQAGQASIVIWLITCYANHTSTYPLYQGLSSELSVWEGLVSPSYIDGHL